MQTDNKWSTPSLRLHYIWLIPHNNSCRVPWDSLAISWWNLPGPCTLLWASRSRSWSLYMLKKVKDGQPPPPHKSRGLLSILPIKPTCVGRYSCWPGFLRTAARACRAPGRGREGLRRAASGTCCDCSRRPTEWKGLFSVRHTYFKSAIDIKGKNCSALSVQYLWLFTKFTVFFSGK